MADKCYPVTVTEITGHPNADRLMLAKVLGFTTVITKGSFNVGEQAWFIETDSVLPPELEQRILGGSKISLSAGRVRAAKIRGVVSEGILVHMGMLSDADVNSILKFEPPTREQTGTHKDRQKYRREYTTEIPRYIDTVRLEKVPKIFGDDERVHITSKLHGTSVRYGWAQLVPQTWWAWTKVWLRRIIGGATEEFVCGTRNVDIGTPPLYHEVAERLDLAAKIPRGMVVFGEIIGPGIQKHYDYGYMLPALRVYAIQRDGKYLDYEAFREITRELKLHPVPLLWTGYWGDIKDKLPALLDKHNVETIEELNGCPCREGLVIGTMVERPDRLAGSRAIVKYINPEYLLNKDNSDDH